MGELGTVLALALLPALGNFAGGLIAEFLPTSRRTLNPALHVAAGIVIAIVAIQLVPRALEVIAGWQFAIAFAIGGLAHIGLKEVVDRLQATSEGPGWSGMWMVYIAVAIDLFSDGLVIGAGSAVATGLALVLALGQVLADVPEGFAAIANLKDKGVPRRRRLLLGASFALPVLAAAGLSYVALRGQGDGLKIAALTFTAGLLMVAAIEDMIAEAHESGPDSRISILAFVGGFVLFTLVSSGLGADG
jgi:zinc transporter, ZIP family